MAMRREFGWGGMVASAVAVASISSPVWADEAELKASLREMAAKIEAMQAKLDAAEKAAAAQAKSAAPAPSAQAVTGGDIPGSFKLPGSNTSVSIGGYVKGVGVYTTRLPLASGTWDDNIFPPGIPLSNVSDSAMRRDHWEMAGREARLIIRTSTPSSYGAITTLLEADYGGTLGTESVTNSHGIRLRHAWGTVGQFGVGQFWSNAVNLTAQPETIDFTPQIGAFGGWRQTQVRWTQPVANGYWSVSLENPESAIVRDATNNGATAFPDNDKIPDLTGKYHFKTGWGEFEVGGILRQITGVPAANELDEIGYAVGLSGFIPTSGQNRFTFDVNVGKGSGRHLGALAPDAVVIGTKMERVDANGGLVSYRHYWTPKLRTTWAYSWINTKYPDGTSAGTQAGLNKKFYTTHLNLIWAVAPRVDLGVEFSRAYRKVETGLDGAMNRVSLMGKFSF